MTTYYRPTGTFELRALQERKGEDNCQAERGARRDDVRSETDADETSDSSQESGAFRERHDCAGHSHDRVVRAARQPTTGRRTH